MQQTRRTSVGVLIGLSVNGYKNLLHDEEITQGLPNNLFHVTTGFVYNSVFVLIPFQNHSQQTFQLHFPTAPT